MVGLLLPPVPFPGMLLLLLCVFVVFFTVHFELLNHGILLLDFGLLLGCLGEGLMFGVLFLGGVVCVFVYVGGWELVGGRFPPCRSSWVECALCPPSLPSGGDVRPALRPRHPAACWLWPGPCRSGVCHCPPMPGICFQGWSLGGGVPAQPPLWEGGDRAKWEPCRAGFSHCFWYQAPEVIPQAFPPKGGGGG